AAAPPGVTAITIGQAVQEALAHNPNLLAEQLNTTIAESAIRTASLRPNPVITASVALPTQALFDAGVTPYQQVFRTDYVIETASKRERGVDHATLIKSMTELQTINTARTLVLDVQTAFTDVQLAKLNLELAEDNLRAFTRVVDINVERARLGDLS